MVKDGGLTRITNNEIENFRPNVSNSLAACDVALLTLKVVLTEWVHIPKIAFQLRISMENKFNKSNLIFKKSNTPQRHLEPLHGHVFNTNNCALQMTT